MAERRHPLLEPVEEERARNTALDLIRLVGRPRAAQLAREELRTSPELRQRVLDYMRTEVKGAV